MLGEALGLVGGGEGTEGEGDEYLDNDMETSSEEEEKQLQNMMYNLMVRICNWQLEPQIITLQLF